jgi:hypothetical protein
LNKTDMACQMRLGTWKVTVVMDDFLQWPMTDIIVPSETGMLVKATMPPCLSSSLTLTHPRCHNTACADDTHKLSYEFSGYPGFDMTTLTYMAPVGTVHLEHIPVSRLHLPALRADG